MTRPAYRTPPSEVVAWVERACGGRIVGTERLLGGITADMDRLVVRRLDGTTDRVVLRRWTDPADWTTGLVEREAAGLDAVAGHGVPAPRVLATEATGANAGVRCLLMTECPGAVQLTPPDLGAWLGRMADMQARIHTVPPSLPVQPEEPMEPDDDLAWIADRGLRDAVLAAAGEPLVDDPVFAHGDYQHYNLLWTGDELTGVVDWTMVCTGTRGLDVGHCRLNLAVLFGVDAAEDYRRRYESAAGRTVDPRADLHALLNWDPGWQGFIPVQVAGRAPLDVAGMPQRVLDTVRLAVDRLG